MAIILSLAFFTTAVLYSLEESVSIAEVEVPKELAERGYTTGRIESVLQQSIQAFYDSPSGALNVFETRPYGPASLLQGFRSGGNEAGERSPPRASAGVSYSTNFAKINSKPFAIVVPGQTQNLNLLLRIAASKFFWAERHSFVSVHVLSTGGSGKAGAGTDDTVDVQLTVWRAGVGTRNFRVLGKGS